MRKLVARRPVLFVFAAILLITLGGALFLGTTPGAQAQAKKSRDPVSICRAIGTSTTLRFAESGARQLAAHVGIPATDYPYGLAWRCSGGKVLVCGVVDMHGVTCSPRDRRLRAQIPEYCREAPNAPFIPPSQGNRLSVYEWGCRRGVPVILRRLIPESSLDTAGFVKSEWRRLP